MFNELIQLHPDFAWQGKSYNQTEIVAHARHILEHSDDTFFRDWATFVLEWFSEKETIIVFTSGTTGTPKKIKVKKAHMQASALATISFFGLQPNTRALLCVPMKYIAGKMMMVRAFIGVWHIEPAQSLAQPLEQSNQSFDFVAMVPLQVEQSLSKIEQCKTLIIGGAPLSHQLREQINTKKCHAFETYGMTETVSHIALKSTKSDKFTAIQEVRFSIDKRGCLGIDAPRVSDVFLQTNDLVDLHSPTTFVWQGRADNIINSGGIKIIPEIIEKKLQSVIENPFFIAGLPSDKYGEEVCLFIENECFEWKEAYQSLLDKYEKPKKVFGVQQFERTPTGKINRIKTIAKVQTLNKK